MKEPVQCRICGTWLKEGQPHTAEKPIMHQSYEMLIVHEHPTETRLKDGSHGPFVPRG